jgi:hypothetical protein
MRFIGLVNGESSEFDGQYLVSYDPTYVPPSGKYDGGKLITTRNPAEAQVFPDVESAIAMWKTQAPKPWDLRPDMKPNRPLTAFNVEIA